MTKVSIALRITKIVCGLFKFVTFSRVNGVYLQKDEDISVGTNPWYWKRNIQWVIEIIVFDELIMKM